MTNNEIIENLERHVCAITFKKIAGETRVMNATRFAMQRGGGNPTHCVVWDVDANDYRAFQFSKLISLEINPNINPQEKNFRAYFAD